MGKYWDKLWKRQTTPTPLEEPTAEELREIQAFFNEPTEIIQPTPTISMQELRKRDADMDEAASQLIEKDKIVSILDEIEKGIDNLLEDAERRRDTTDHLLFTGKKSLIFELRNRLEEH